ncbi:hypothetical protein GCM10028801_31930 [Nocardioides maradonensis]
MVLIERFRTAPRATQLLVALAAAHVLLKLFLLAFVGQVTLCCDQVAYNDGAMALSNLVRDLAGGGPIHLAELQRNLVGGGWFTPGSSIALAPLYVVDPHASTLAVRAYLGVFSSLLLLLTVLRVRRVLGDLFAIVLMLLVGLSPTWLLFSMAAWGDLIAGLLATILLMELITLMRTLVAGRAPRLLDGVRFGLAAVATVYARSSSTLLVLGMGVVLAVTALVALRGRIRRRALLSFVVGGVSFAMLLAPWSAFASYTLKSPVLTTTTVPVVMSITFGDRDRVCFGPCDPMFNPGTTTGNTWFPPMQYSREVQRATGRSEVEVEKQMWTYTRPSVTPHSYTKDVIGDFGRYAGKPASFAKLLMPGGPHGIVYWLVFVLTYLAWIPLLLSVFALILARIRATVDQQVIALMTTIGLGALFTQPFVHIGTGRYWTTAAPLAAIGVALLIRAWDARRDTPRFTGAPWVVDVPAEADAPPVRTWLTWAQRVLAALTVLAVVGVLLLGLT